MDYVNLGRTGLKVSRICLGMMTYGTSQWRPWILDESDSRPIVKRAVELGINFFDTADMYSAGASEELTGKFLQEFTRRDEVVIATKVFFPVDLGFQPGNLRLSFLDLAPQARLALLHRPGQRVKLAERVLGPLRRFIARHLRLETLRVRA